MLAVVHDTLPPRDSPYFTLTCHFLGFQECENVDQVVAGVPRMSGRFDTYSPTEIPGPGDNPAPVAWDSQRFDKLDAGWMEIGSDQYGKRVTVWVRLLDRDAGSTVFFANTHGPLGDCSKARGDDWLRAVTDNMMAGDMLVYTGDFNCGTGTAAINVLDDAAGGAFKLVAKGGVGGIAGIDLVFTNSVQLLASWRSVSGYPSDHPLVAVVFEGSEGGDGGDGGDDGDGTAGACDPAAWDSALFKLACGECAALVRIGSGGGDGTCATFCTLQGLGCVEAWDDVNDDCGNPAPALRSCDYDWATLQSTSDAVCKCTTPPLALSPPASLPPSSPPLQSHEGCICTAETPSPPLPSSPPPSLPPPSLSPSPPPQHLPSCRAPPPDAAAIPPPPCRLTGRSPRRRACADGGP